MHSYILLVVITMMTLTFIDCLLQIPQYSFRLIYIYIYIYIISNQVYQILFLNLVSLLLQRFSTICTLWCGILIGSFFIFISNGAYKCNIEAFKPFSTYHRNFKNYLTSTNYIYYIAWKYILNWTCYKSLIGIRQYFKISIF